jgi:hypothetical protein
MGIARSLFLAVIGTASLTIACVTPWQDSANLDVSSTPQDNVLVGADAAASPGRWQTSTRAGAPTEEELPAQQPEVATLAPRIALGSQQNGPSLPADRLPLAQQLQRELARVGCYEGEANGIWTPAARKAMKAFMDRINATLPTDEPDYILLTLVQAARDRVCGATCPAGQGLAESGRCVPNAILAGKKAPPAARAAPARAEPAPAPATPGWSVARTPTAATPSSSPDPERMGLAGPSAPNQPGQVNDQAPPTAAALPGQPGPAPTVTAVPASRPADVAKRAATPTPPSNFGPAVFRQSERLGF